MKIILVRHAKSDYDWSRWSTDSIRPLSEKGITRQHKASKGFVTENLAFDEAWVSPYTRAQQTLDIILQYQSEEAPVKINNNLPPFGNPEEILEQLKAESLNSKSKTILLVGHNPNISELLELLSGDNNIHEMRTSDVAVCEMKNKKSKLIMFYPREELYK